MNYYRRFMADYGAKTAALSLAEHGAYTLLLDICYSTEKPLPAAYDALYRLCRAMNKSEQDAVKSVADAFFPVGEDGLRHNPRADAEISKAQSTIAKQRESGVESAAKRWSTDGSTHESTDAAAIQPPTSNSSLNPQPQGKSNVGLPPDADPAGQRKTELRKTAGEVIAFLNAKAGRNFDVNGANADHVVARLRDGETVEDLRAVIAMKVRDWKGDEKMAEYLRPETLFNRTKFASYKGKLTHG